MVWIWQHESMPLLLAMVEKPKTKLHTDNRLPHSVLSGRVSHSSSGDRRVPWLSKSSMVWKWKHDSMPLLLAMAEKPKTEVHTDNELPPSVLSGRVSHSSSGDRRVPWLRKSLMVWKWQHDSMPLL
jgi:hypothetical protein